MIKAGMDAAARAKVMVTPTVLVNGWQAGYSPAEAVLDQLISDLLAGKTPSLAASR
jgi:hypothetical protein